jgi:VWFA-related protein
MSIQTRLAIVLLAMSAGSLSAQQPVRVPSAATKPVPAAEGGPAAPTGRISLDVEVTGKSGMPVPGLQQQDFTILDDKRPGPISSFRAVTAVEQEPVTVTLVIDAVNTSFSIVSSERQQIEGFLRANGGHLSHPTALAVFMDTGIEVQPEYSTDGNALSGVLEKYTVGLREIRRSSGFYGADERTELSLAALSQLTTRLASRWGRKIVVWISPGWPLLSGPGVELTGKQERQIFGNIVSFSTRLRQAHITLYGADPLGAGESVGRTFYYLEYVKGISKPSRAELGDLSLQVLAVQSGGLALASSNDVRAYLKRAFADASAYYELSFEAPPAEHPDEYHSIQVQVAKPGLTVRSQQGYYAQP